MHQYITFEWGFLQLAHLDGAVESRPLLDHHGTVFGVGPMTEHLSMRIQLSFDGMCSAIFSFSWVARAGGGTLLTHSRIG